ncbi:MAG: flagellar biosynthesis protein FlhB [Proteobacteria bacterium]|nr:flagellar biosynthesis protein FlhB [Pseudomonadota bacterium]
MAEGNQDQEKTEQPTPKRREEAKKKGQVAKSQEVASATILLVCLIFFYFNATGMFEQVLDMMRWMFLESGSMTVNSANIQALMVGFIYRMFVLLFPLFMIVVAAGMIANFLQVGFMFSTESIQPKLSKIDPIKGFQKFFSLKTLVELVKNIFKISIVGFIAYLVIKGEIRGLFPLMEQSVWGILSFIGRVVFKIVFVTCLALIVLAILDYVYQKWEHEKELKMSKQEVKDEFKQTEGDPLVKARIRRLQREAARHRMMANVPTADVVITNPTHIAVALKYDQAEMFAPKVVAKGRGFIAERIKEIARENGVTIVENKPVAQVLYKIVDVDEMIPENLYRAVAEILAYVYGLKASEA